jgi:hypothetical protein
MHVSRVNTVLESVKRLYHVAVKNCQYILSNVYMVFLANLCVRLLSPEGKRPLGRPRCRWEDNIKMDFQEVGGVGGEWMERAQDRDRWQALVSTVMKFRVTNAENFLTSCKTS